MSQRLLQRDLPVIIAFILGLMVVASQFIVIPGIKDLVSIVIPWGAVMANFVIGLGIVTLTTLHARNIMKQVSGKWVYSVAFLVAMFGWIILGLFIGRGDTYTFWYSNLNRALQDATFSLMGCFVLTALLRAFRARSIETTVLIISVCLSILMRVPIGAAIWSGFPTIGSWILSVPNKAANRAIIMASALGVTVFTLRVFLGREKGFLGGD
jgi:hypothetical protein